MRWLVLVFVLEVLGSCGKGELIEQCIETYENGEKKICYLFRKDRQIGSRTYYQTGVMRAQCIRKGIDIDREYNCLYFDEDGTIILDTVKTNIILTIPEDGARL